MKIFLPLVILIVAALVVVAQSAFTVDQTQYAVVTRFGQIKRVIPAEPGMPPDPGLHFKTPFVEDVLRYDNRLLRVDVRTESMQDREKQILEIDAYVRYRIVDPAKFFLKLTDEFTAENRISNIVISEVRQVVANSDRTDIIGGVISTLPDGTVRVDPKKTDAGVDTRTALTRQVLAGVNRAVQSRDNDFGIEVVDIRIKAADFPSTVAQSVYNRMRTEREVQGQRLRAEGEQQNLTITADVDRQVTIIRADADRTGNQLRGEGEGQAIAIFAGALEQDPEFYAFQRSLELYRNALSKNTTLILNSEDDLLRYLTSPNPTAAAPTPAQ
ncbi:MAG: protease modulator HflC [Chloroflexi bacterium]|nr:protease modulator HflC [Chloroflexota bacterium]